MAFLEKSHDARLMLSVIEAMFDTKMSVAPIKDGRLCFSRACYCAIYHDEVKKRFGSTGRARNSRLHFADLSRKGAVSYLVCNTCKAVVGPGS